MATTEIFASLWIVFSYLHVCVAVFDCFDFVALLYFDDKLLCAVACLTFFDAPGLVNDRHPAHVLNRRVFAAIFFGCGTLDPVPPPLRFALVVAAYSAGLSAFMAAAGK